MREYLFRGYSEYLKEWVYGDLSLVYEKGVVVAAYVNNIHVRIETVGQFTGLCDKNGKRIFEGDIVKLQDEKYEIVWGADGNAEGYIVQGFGCRHNAKYFMGTMTLRTKMCESLEVIGNIHDNPELL